MPILQEDTINCRVICIGVDFKQLKKFRNLNISNKESLFSSPQEPFIGLPFIKRQFLFEGSMRGFCHMQKPFTKISIEVKFRNDLTFLVVINFAWMPYASNFFKLNLTPSQVNTCPKRSISSWASLLFTLFPKNINSNLFQTCFKRSTYFSMVLKFTSMSSIYMMTNLFNFSWKNEFIKVEGMLHNLKGMIRNS